MFLYGPFTMESYKNVPISFDTPICPSIPSTKNITIQDVQNRLSLTSEIYKFSPKSVNTIKSCLKLTTITDALQEIYHTYFCPTLSKTLLNIYHSKNVAHKSC